MAAKTTDVLTRDVAALQEDVAELSQLRKAFKALRKRVDELERNVHHNATEIDIVKTQMVPLKTPHVSETNSGYSSPYVMKHNLYDSSASPKRSAASDASPAAVVAEKPTGAVLGVSQDQNKGTEFTADGKDARCYYLFGEGAADSDSESKYTHKKKKSTRKKKKQSRESDQDALEQKPHNLHKNESVANVKVGKTVSAARKKVKARRNAATSTAAPAEPTNTELDDAKAEEWEPIHNNVIRLKPFLRFKPISPQLWKLLKYNAEQLTQFKMQTRASDCLWLAQVLQHCEHEGHKAHFENVLLEIKYVFKKYGSHLGSFYTNDDDSKQLKEVLQTSLVEVKDQAIYEEMESLSRHLNIGDSCCKLIATDDDEQVKKVHDQPQIAAAKPAPELTVTNLAKPTAKQQEPVSADPITQPQIAAKPTEPTNPKRHRIVSSEIPPPEDDDSRTTSVKEQDTGRKSYNTANGWPKLKDVLREEKKREREEEYSEVVPPSPASTLSGLDYEEEQAKINEDYEKEAKRRKKEDAQLKKRLLQTFHTVNEVEANNQVDMAVDSKNAPFTEDVVAEGWSQF